jgi:ubiquitin C-terminal hydrolase
MDISRHDPRKIYAPIGFENSGATCYYNSLLQCLFSCSTFVEYIEKGDGEYVESFAKILDAMKKASSEPSLATENWRIMMKTAAKKGITFGGGQQCALEAYTVMLDCLPSRFKWLFTHRRNNKLRCPSCRKICSSIQEVNTFFDINHDTRSRDINQCLKSYKTDVDENHVCSLCGFQGRKIKTSSLVMIPEILVVVSKKYEFNGVIGRKLEHVTCFPEELHFNTNKGKKVAYKAVAQVEHYGSLGSGHYNCICKRKDWYMADDSKVKKNTPNRFKPTKNTYIVFYHAI